ncbi:hypothetical protein MHLP_03445 [Candidatus Mycoplasma haematolamae str. Purdue]|uniref:Trigger factor C-terminal domain-containing protein n=1 Tax=Mycoplasma haematolamae (strain Purdue) TaxID=1212765 RepID=I7CK56_MYCHA|nr:hypothetical protein [Candidatus Mycoplasma haematolamae]AFO52269.1 hypothetical protein MHLP_03445 [Candidatus Mycoplasma haematolamae str. Purdue]
MNANIDSMKSKIVSKKAVQWGRVLRVEELHANEFLVKNFVETLKSNHPDLTEAQIEEEKTKMIVRDNLYNLAMDEVSSAYNIEVHEDDQREREEEFRKSHPFFTEEQVKSNARVSIYKQLIYEDLAKEWEIEVTTEATKMVLENFYQHTGKSVNEYLNNPEKLEGVKGSILEQLITERIMNAFGQEVNAESKVSQKS